jgi:cytochrome c553
MKKPSAILLAVVCFALGAVIQRVYDVRRMATAGQQQATGAPAAEPAPAPVVVQFDREPLWAYGFTDRAKEGDTARKVTPPNRVLRKDEDANEQTRLRKVDGAPNTYSLLDVRDGHNVVDWFPAEHPPMPSVVAHGPKRLDNPRGCGSCHLPTGQGRPENAPVVGLPKEYFIRQIQDFRSGLRRSADPRKPNTNSMIELARGLSDDEVKAAAEYFGSMPFPPQWIRVVETDSVPKTRIIGNLFLALEEPRTQPINGRIIEVPVNEEQSETYRNPHSGFIAYVPAGSLKKGEDLVTTGGMRVVGDKIVQGKTTACGTCHGIDLMGVADVPPIAGRSASYLTRQIFDIQQGTRRGVAAQLMKMVVANLTEEDLVAITAYVASRPPIRTAQPITQVANR